MDLQSLTIRQLKTMLKQFSVVSLGVRDIILMHAIEDELARRQK